MTHKELLMLMAERIAADPALAQRAAQITNAQTLTDFAKNAGVTLAPDEAARLLPKFRALASNDGKLSDDILDTVAGGVGNCTCRASTSHSC